MAIFAIIRQPGLNSEKLGDAITEKFPASHYDLGDGVWLVFGPGTAKEVSDIVGITPDASAGIGIVIEVASYFGRANPAVWSWVKNNWEAKTSG